ncbi:hypothetical protein CEXT_243551 [Caerostris extrusa]|uniref:Uncharacterized protein n=1 Tax=Caerostris extrusa TaxID=172846 RepID=A0AAV4RT05_CAEEX|nr:hypothetical protein CEXT_243551 [Caerostris extrusa]
MFVRRPFHLKNPFNVLLYKRLFFSQVSDVDIFKPLLHWFHDVFRFMTCLWVYEVDSESLSERSYLELSTAPGKAEIVTYSGLGLVLGLTCGYLK